MTYVDLSVQDFRYEFLWNVGFDICILVWSFVDVYNPYIIPFSNSLDRHNNCLPGNQ